MAGTSSVSLYDSTINAAGKKIRRLKWAWAVTGTVTTATGGTIQRPVTGRIIGIKAVPGVGAGHAPKAAYDIDILDAINGMNVLNDDGDDFATAITDTGNIRVPVDSQNNRPIYLVGETLSFSGANLSDGGAADAADGVFYLYIREP